MKILCVLVALGSAAVVGCASTSPHLSARTAPLHPSGTDVGTPNPGVNQGTGDTTATAASDSR